MLWWDMYLQSRVGGLLGGMGGGHQVASPSGDLGGMLGGMLGGALGAAACDVGNSDEPSPTAGVDAASETGTPKVKEQTMHKPEVESA